MQPLPSGQPSCHLCHARDALCPLSSFLDSPGAGVATVSRVLSNTEMLYLSISCWRDGHGRSKYLSVPFCPVCLDAGRRVLTVQLQGNPPAFLSISHQNHGPQTIGQTSLFEKERITLNLQPHRSDWTAVRGLRQEKRRQTRWLPCCAGDRES